MTAEARCPLCGQASPFFFGAGDRNRRVSRERFAYRRCPSCASVFLRPAPPNLADYYPDDYYAIPPSREELEARAEGQRHKIEAIRQFVPCGRLLEIGPSYGSFAYLAARSGFQVDAIEMSERCCAYLEQVVRVRAVQSLDPGAAMQGMGPYDVIALYQVIEHLPDPAAVLRAAVAALAPGGLLVIATPNPDSMQFRTFRRWWFHLDAPRHLQLIPATTLTRCAEEQGLKRVHLTANDPEAHECNMHGWSHSLGGFAGHRLLRRCLLSFGYRISRGVRWLEERELRGSSYTAIFQKGPRSGSDDSSGIEGCLPEQDGRG